MLDLPRIIELAQDVAVHDLDTTAPRITFTHDGRGETLHCDIIAGCDGFHGVSRETIPAEVRTVHERVYPFAWLGILAEVAPSTDELIYAWHPDVFALHSMRSHSISRSSPNRSIPHSVSGRSRSRGILPSIG